MFAAIGKFNAESSFGDRVDELAASCCRDGLLDEVPCETGFDGVADRDLGGDDGMLSTSLVSLGASARRMYL